MRKLYMVQLTGMGDTDISFVEKDVFDWIESKDKAGRVGNESQWKDTNTPQVIIDGMNGDKHEGDPDYVGAPVSIGSFDNDKALYSEYAAVTINGERASFWDLKTALVFIKDNDIDVVDTYEGMIY